MNIWSVVIPLVTLVLGYSLNVLKSAIDFSRETERINIEKGEHVYEEVFTRLFSLFKNYWGAVISCGLRYCTADDKGGRDISGNIESLVRDDFKDLENLLYSKSLLIDADVFEALLKIPEMFMLRLLSYEKLEKKLDIKNIVQFENHHVNLLWKYALIVMNKVRKKIRLDKYPDNFLSFWNEKITIADV